MYVFLLGSFSIELCDLNRCVLLMYLIHSCRSVWVLEQPGSSLAHRARRFRELTKRMRIFTVSFWMCFWGSPSPKRTRVWSNSRGISRFRTPTLTKKHRNKLPVRLAKNNGKHWTGDKELLKASALLGCISAGVVSFCPEADLYSINVYCDLRAYPSGFAKRFAGAVPHLRAGVPKPKKAVEAYTCVREVIAITQ